MLPVPLVPDGRTIRQNQMAQAGRVDTNIVIPVTNAIESLNSKLRSAVRGRGHFPSDEAAINLLYLVLRHVSQG
jgi:transposase-like protein